MVRQVEKSVINRYGFITDGLEAEPLNIFQVTRHTSGYNSLIMRSFLSRLLILFAILGLIAVPIVLSVNADVRRANENFAAGHYASAAADYEHAARLYVWRGDLWERAGHAAFAGGDLNEAIRLLELAPALSIQGWTDLGTAYFQLGQVDNSIHAFQRGLDARGAAPSLYLGLVLDYNSQGDLEAETSALGNYLAFVDTDAPDRASPFGPVTRPFTVPTFWAGSDVAPEKQAPSMTALKCLRRVLMTWPP